MYVKRVRPRFAPLLSWLLLAAVTTVVGLVACSGGSKDPPPHPPVTADCQLPPIGSVTGPKCPGICIDQVSCDGSSPSCPAGFRNEGSYGCPNSALCCYFDADGGAEAGADASVDSAGVSSDASRAD